MELCWNGFIRWFYKLLRFLLWLYAYAMWVQKTLWISTPHPKCLCPYCLYACIIKIFFKFLLWYSPFSGSMVKHSVKVDSHMTVFFCCFDNNLKMKNFALPTDADWLKIKTEKYLYYLCNEAISQNLKIIDFVK